MERNAPELNFCKSHVFFAAVLSSIFAPALCQALDHVQDRVECTSLRVARTVGNSARRNCRPWRRAMLRPAGTGCTICEVLKLLRLRARARGTAPWHDVIEVHSGVRDGFACGGT